MVVGEKSDVPPDPKTRTNPAVEGVVLGGEASGAVVGKKSDFPANLKGQKKPAVDGIVPGEGVTGAVVGEKTLDLKALKMTVAEEIGASGEVTGEVTEVTGGVVGRKSANLTSPVPDVRSSKTAGTVSDVGGKVGDLVGVVSGAGYNHQVRGSLVLE